MLTGARRYTVSSFPFATFLRNLGYPGQQRVVPIEELTTDTAEWAKDVAATVRVLYTIPRPLRLSTIIGRQIIGRPLRRMRERMRSCGRMGRLVCSILQTQYSFVKAFMQVLRETVRFASVSQAGRA